MLLKVILQEVALGPQFVHDATILDTRVVSQLARSIRNLPSLKI